MIATVIVAGIIGCARSRRAGSDDRRRTADALSQMIDISTFYRRLGRLAASEPLPFVGTVVFAAAPGDSVTAVTGLSLENRALSFQREGNAFVARYRVTLSFLPGAGAPIDLSREEVVRVGTFQETLRADESVLFQQALRILPGTYRVVVTVRDIGSNAESRAEREFTAPAFGSGTTTGAILAYQATGRGSAADQLSLVLNSRGAVAYGADTLLAYVEGYDFPGPATVPFEVQDEQEKVIFRDSLRFRGGRPVESQVLRLAPDSVSLGELKFLVGQGESQRLTSALVSFSQAWVITNFDEVLDLLRHFGRDERVAAMRRAPAAERSRLWREFYRDTDPEKTTPENEALTEYFGRIASVNKLFTDEAVPGWRTDRGEVFINLGPPDETAESTPGQSGRVVRWSYLAHRLTLFFQDETGFGRLRLTTGSRAEFERTLSRIRRQGA